MSCMYCGGEHSSMACDEKVSRVPLPQPAPGDLGLPEGWMVDGHYVVPPMPEHVRELAQRAVEANERRKVEEAANPALVEERIRAMAAWIMDPGTDLFRDQAERLDPNRTNPSAAPADLSERERVLEAMGRYSLCARGDFSTCRTGQWSDDPSAWCAGCLIDRAAALLRQPAPVVDALPWEVTDARVEALLDALVGICPPGMGITADEWKRRARVELRRHLEGERHE